jgi:hypothetical protein
MIESGLFYTVTTPAGTFQLNPTAYSGDGYYLQEPDLDNEFGAVVQPKALSHGSIVGDTRVPGLKWGVSVICAASTASARQALEDNLRKYVGSMLDADGAVAWTPQDASSARSWRNVRALSLPRPTGRVGVHKIMAWEMGSKRHTIDASTETSTDSEALTTDGGGFAMPFGFPIIFSPSGGGSLTVPNAGTARAHPVMQIHGPITNPILVNVDTQERITMAGSIVDGDYWEVDLFDRTVKLNGATNIREVVDTSATTWFGIAAGGEDVTLVGSDFDAGTVLTVLSRAAWWL